MHKVIGWRVWYSDRCISSKEARWEDLPADDVQFVMLYHEGGTRRVMSGNDFYWRWRSGFGMVYAHANEFDPERYPGATMLRGKWTSDENLNRIEFEAMESSWQ
jgi:hypothetical protein